MLTKFFSRSLCLLLLLLLASSSAAGATQAATPARAEVVAVSPAGNTPRYAPGRLILKVDPSAGTAETSALLNSALLSLGLEQVSELAPGTGEYLLAGASPRVDVRAAAAHLAAQPGVLYATPDYLLTTYLTPNDSLYQQHQWYMPSIRAEEAWDITIGSESIIIGGIDTGVSQDHPDLRGKLLPGFNAIRGDGSSGDDNGHGTFTAGLFGAETNNNNGIAGVCWSCKILPVKILNSQGGGSVSSFAVGIRWAVDNGARVLNISAGVDFEVPTMEEAVKYAHSRNVVLVASAGNTPDGKPRYPAGYQDVIAVGATGPSDTTTGFSSYGPYVDISAPGVGILSTAWEPGNSATYDFANGTSASAPFVAGAAGLVLSLNPGLTPEQVQAVLVTTADDIEAPGWDDRSGWGRLNIVRALQTVRSGNIPALPQVPSTAPPPASTPPAVGGSTIRGKVTGVAPTEVQVALSPQRIDVAPRTANVGADGFYSFENLPPGRYSVGVLLRGGQLPPTPVDVEVDGQGSTVREVNFAIGGAAPPPAAGGVSPTGPRPTAFDPVGQPGGFSGRYFEATGHTLSGPFLDYWQRNGGLAIFGYPLSEPFQEISQTDGKAYLVQYFERNRFEHHPEFAGTPNEVLLGLLGRTVSAGRTFPPGQQIAEDANHRWFQATQHSLSDAFLRYWQQNGGLAIFGYPISEPVMERSAEDGKEYLVQYFERNRFELHPEFAGTPSEVLLGRLGVEVLRTRGWR